ncbi:MAG: hypothetical protein ACR2QO_24610 [Acidimicrobiales bacterium]
MDITGEGTGLLAALMIMLVLIATLVVLPGLLVIITTEDVASTVEGGAGQPGDGVTGPTATAIIDVRPAREPVHHRPSSEPDTSIVRPRSRWSV